METKYIAVQEAKHALVDLPAELDAVAVQRCIEALGHVPAADVVPVRHGHWVKPVPGDGEPYCSECKYDAPCTGGGFIMQYWYPAFCPSCGAKMDAD